MEPYILAIDQGTTGSTILLFDRAGEVVSRAYRELPQHFPRPGWVEHDPIQIWEGVLEATGKVLSRVGVGDERHGDTGAAAGPAGAGNTADGAGTASEPQSTRSVTTIAAIGITNQRETVVMWDRESGRPLHNAIVWQDRRTAPACEAMRRAGDEPEIRKRTGLLLDPYFSGTKMAWLLDHVEGARERAARGEVLLGTVDSWLIWMLSGGRAHATDMTNASRTLLFNIHRREWDEGLLERLRIPRAALPEVVPSMGEVGCTEGQGPMPGGIPIAGIAGDQQAALFGQACTRPGAVKNTYGTGCFLLMHTGEKAVPSEHGLLTTVALGYPDGRVTYALEGSIFVAGAAIQWLRDGLGIIKDAAESEALATSVKGTGGVYLVPAFAGLGAPYWDPEARGTLVGLTRGTGRAEIVRAALESIAYQTRDVVELMRRESGIEVPHLRVDGGAAANNFLLQFQADQLGVPVERPSNTETTALGAAYLAGLGVGVWSGEDELAALWKSDRVFEPRGGKRAAGVAGREMALPATNAANTAESTHPGVSPHPDELYQGWRRAVERALKWDADTRDRENEMELGA